MFNASNDKSLIVLTRADYEKALKDAFEKGVASVAKEDKTVSHAKSEIKTTKGGVKVRKAVVENE